MTDLFSRTTEDGQELESQTELRNMLILKCIIPWKAFS